MMSLLCIACRAALHGTESPKIDSLSAMLEETGQDTVRVRLLMDLSREFQREDVVRAFEYAHRAVLEATATEDGRLLGAALMNAFRVSYYHGRADIAADYLLRYRELVEAEGNTAEVLKANANMGAIWMMLKRFDKAEQAYEGLLEVLESDSTSDRAKLSVVYGNLGLANAEQMKWDKAESFYKKGIMLSERYPEAAANLGRLLHNYGNLLVSGHDFEQAFEKLSAARDIYALEGNKAAACGILWSLGKAYREQGKTDRAMEHYRQGYALAMELGSIIDLRSFAEATYELYEETGPADSTLKYLNLYHQYEKEAKLSDTAEKLFREELAVKYRKWEKEQLRRQRADRRGMAGIVFLAIVIAASAAWLAFRSRKNMRRSELAKLQLERNARRLEMEKGWLNSQVEKKDKELTTQVMYAMQKNEQIGGVVEKLARQQDMRVSAHPGSLDHIIRELEKTREDHVWEDFELRFKLVHRQFYDILNERFPELTPNERRLCAFLKLNFSSKEISTITGQTPHSIKVARTRLRKKLGLTHSDQGLVEFLASIG